MATVSAGATRATLMALYVVTPAQVKGAASREETASGTGVANAAGASAYSANVPLTEYPEFCWLSHNVSHPPMQCRHSPHADPSHAMATRSPTERIVTPVPSSSTIPTPS